MLPGYLQEDEVETAILALQLELEDIEELASSASGDSAIALQNRRIDGQHSLQLLRDRQFAAHQDSQGARTAAALRRGPPQLHWRHVPTAIPQALRIDPETIPHPRTADTIIPSSGPREVSAHNPTISTRVDFPSVLPTQPEQSSSRSAKTASAPPSTPKISNPQITRAGVIPTPAHKTSQDSRSLAYANAPPQTTLSVSSIDSATSFATAKTTLSAIASKTNIDDELAIESAATWENETSEISHPKIPETLNEIEPSGLDPDLKVIEPSKPKEQSRSVSDQKVSRNPNRNERSNSHMDKHATTITESKTSAPEGTKLKSCPVCVEDVKALTKLPCNHEYCSNCLQRMFTDACNYPSRYPPACCSRKLPVDEVKEYLKPDLVELFRAKVVEYETEDRTYCSNLQCGTFIPTKAISSDVGTCGKCKKATCTLCKYAAHKDDCPLDYGLQQVLRLSEKMGWQRCQKCKAMVGIIDGCNHMTFVSCLSKHLKITTANPVP